MSAESELPLRDTDPAPPPDPDSDMPQMRCPHCGKWETDFDGLGMLAHTKSAYPDGCGYCTHPSASGGVCDICGERLEPDAPETQRSGGATSDQLFLEDHSTEDDP